jgi:hypothetical protein
MRVDRNQRRILIRSLAAAREAALNGELPVAANASTSGRTGTFTAAGKTFR